MSNRMHTAPRRALAAAVLACPLAGLVTEAHAAIVIDIYQNGTGVRADLSGSFNTGIASNSTTSFDADHAVRGGNGSQNGVFFGSGVGFLTANIWTGSVTSTPEGVDRFSANAASFTYATEGTTIGVASLQLRWAKTLVGDTVPNFYADNSYTGGAVSGSMTFASTTMAALGLDNYGSFVFTFGSGTTDTVTVNLLQSSPVVIPGAGIAGLATLGLAGIARRRRR